MSGSSGSSFIDDFTNRVVEASHTNAKLEELEYRIKRIERVLDTSVINIDHHPSKIHYYCTGKHNHNYTLNKRYHPLNKALYCDKCDALYCNKDYCRHLEDFVKNQNKK